MKLIFSLLTTSLLAFSSYGECLVKYDREACPGMHRTGKTNQEISFKKCGGQKTCVKQKGASSKEQCIQAAIKACGNKRFTITKSKVVTATWNGEELKDSKGSADFCLNYAKRNDEYFKCAN